MARPLLGRAPMGGRRISGVGTFAAVVLSACGGSATVRDAHGPEAATAASLVHPAGGWLEHARSPIVPFCQGVLVAPDVVVTAARCADEGWHELSFGTGDVDGESIPVIAALRHPLAFDDPAHALVALVLAHPVEEATPARLAAPDPAPCGVELPTYRAVLRGQPGERDVWTACPSDDAGHGASLVAMQGYPSCHGESGAGAFVPGELDEVIGWVTTAGRDGPPHPEDEICATSVGLATVARNRDWLAESLGRSRVTAPFRATPAARGVSVAPGVL